MISRPLRPRKEMPMLRPLLAFALLLPFAAGCAFLGNASTNRVLASYEPEGSAQVVQAPREATYALCQPPPPGEPATGQEHLRAQVKVSCGKPIGFEKSETGDLLAVAGEQKFPLPEGDYWWRCATSPDGFYKAMFRRFAEAPELVGEHCDLLWMVLYPVGVAAYFLLPVAGALK
jgi:hypothetical protein